MEPVVPKFIDDLIDFSTKDKKKDEGATLNKTIRQEPGSETPQEDPQIQPGQEKSLNRH